MATNFENKATLQATIGGQPFTFTSNTVTNTKAGLTIVKTSSVTGDVITGQQFVYSFVCANTGSTPVTSITFSDTYPVGLSFVTSSFKYNGTSVTPVQNVNTLSYVIPTIAGSGSATIEFAVVVL